MTAARGFRRWFRRLLMSPVERGTEDFMAMGMGEEEAFAAAFDLWLACRTAMPTPRWIIDRCGELAAALDRRLADPPRPGDGPEYHADLAFWKDGVRALGATEAQIEEALA